VTRHGIISVLVQRLPVVASGEPLLDWQELEREVLERRVEQQ
jgi:hypothetical protein